MPDIAIAPAHIGHGSSVTTSVQPFSRLRPSAAAARRSASTSACAVGSPVVSRSFLARATIFVHNDRADRHFARKLRLLRQRQRFAHPIPPRHPRSLPLKNSATVPGPEWLPMTGPTALRMIRSGSHPNSFTSVSFTTIASFSQSPWLMKII